MASFNPPTQFQIGDWVEYPASPAISTTKNGRCWPNHQFHGGWKVQASHFIVAALGNHTSSHTLFNNGPLKGQGWHQGMQKDGRCWLNHQFLSGLKGWSQPFVCGSWAALEPKWRNAKKWFAHLPWACLHMAQGRAPFQRLCPHPRHLWSNDQWLWIRTTWIMAALQKPEQISTDFTYNLKITIK